MLRESSSGEAPWCVVEGTVDHYRELTVGRLLLEAALELAAQSVELVQLVVVKDNEPAVRLYESVGFEAYGLEQRALKIDGRYYDDILMAKDLPCRRST